MPSSVPPRSITIDSANPADMTEIQNVLEEMMASNDSRGGYSDAPAQRMQLEEDIDMQSLTPPDCMAQPQVQMP